jgi:hypothetical protein
MSAKLKPSSSQHALSLILDDLEKIKNDTSSIDFIKSQLNNIEVFLKALAEKSSVDVTLPVEGQEKEAKLTHTECSAKFDVLGNIANDLLNEFNFLKEVSYVLYYFYIFI